MKKTARIIFEDELGRRQIPFQRSDDGLYRLQIEGVTISASLDNIRRDAEREDDPEAVRRFVDQLVRAWPEVPEWAEASRLLLFSAESAQREFGETLRSAVTNDVTRVLTLTDRDQSRITWVTPGKLEVEEIDGDPLGMVPIDSPYKASVIFAVTFRDLVEPELGWPVLAVIPCRDFIYVLADQSELIGRIGEVVVREFQTSGYPITTEVLRISDAGIEAIGHFPPT